MLEARNLKKVYKIKDGNVVNALDGVSLKLPDTGMVFILGKSGSGKSTLLNVLGGLDSFDSGEIIIKGSSAKDFKQSHYDSYRNTYIGFIFQEYNVLEELTVGANIALAIELQGRRATNEEINAILREVDLDGLGQRKPNELSGGQKQRVAIARALVKRPEIIMADEPTGALDSVTGKQVFDTLKKLSNDKLVLIVSHDREFSEQYADRIIELKDGKIISDVEKAAYDSDAASESEDKDFITYGDGEITLKAGYELSEDDRIAINEYIKAYSSGTVIKVDKNNKKKYSSKDFSPTDESKIKSDKTGDFKLIKSRLSIKNAFKLGSGALKYKKIRLALTIFLSLISFTLFGVADTIAAYDNISTATNSIYDTGVSYASFTKLVREDMGYGEYWQMYNNYLTPEEIELIRTKTGEKVIGIYNGRYDNLSFSSNLAGGRVEGMRPSVIYPDTFSGVSYIDNALIAAHGLRLLGDSRLPEPNTSEIVITKYVYDYFALVGHTALGDAGEVKTEIKSVSDILGKKIKLTLDYTEATEFTIVGVVDTGFDVSRYEKLAAEDAEYTVSFIENMALTSELQAAQQYSFAGVLFVHPTLMEGIIEGAKKAPERVDGGNGIRLYKVVDDSGNNENELYGEDRTNMLQAILFQSFYSLDNIKDDIVWLGAPKDSLNDNQVVISVSALRNMMNSDYRVMYDGSKLSGYEKTIFDRYKAGEIVCVNPTLMNQLQNPKYFAAFSYAYNNLSEAKALYSAYAQVDNLEEVFTNFAREFYNAFANVAKNGYFDEVITDEIVSKHVTDLATKYGVTDALMSDEMYEFAVAKLTYGGVEYTSYDVSSYVLIQQLIDRSDDIFAYKYAFENFDDALNFYKLKNPQIPDAEIEFWYVIAEYCDYLRYNTGAQSDFVPTADVPFSTYKIQALLDFYSLISDDSKLVIGNQTSKDGFSLVKNAEIVGVFLDDYKLGNATTIVASESLLDSVLGANRGGIYSFAVSAMPATKSEIKDIVKFTKTYVSDDGNVKYNLSNSVTAELDMVDEILDVLGKVFIYVGIGLAVFASLMLTNFISTSITYKKQEIGILRAIGSRSADVFRIFFAESFIIAMISYVLSVIGTVTVTVVVNNALRNNVGMLITILNFSIRQVGILLLISLLVALVATFFPVNKIASMKPIDAIKNRK